MEKFLTLGLPRIAACGSLSRLLSFVLVGAVGFCWLSTRAEAVTVRVAGAGGSVPTISHDFALQGPLTVTLELFNEAVADQVIALWQLGLELEAVGGATGALEFSSVGIADDPLFTVMPGPSPPVGSPSADLVVSAADTSMDFGQNLPAGTAANIVDLMIGSQVGTAGLFGLRMNPFDFVDPDASLWFPSLMDIPQAFSNSSPEGPIVVARIEMVPEPASLALLAWGLALGPLGSRGRRERH